MTKKNLQKKQFTMLELIVAMAILIVFLLFLTKFFTTTQELLSASETKNDQVRRARELMDTFTMDMRSVYYESGIDGQHAPSVYKAWSSPCPFKITIRRDYTMVHSDGTLTPYAVANYVCRWVDDNGSASDIHEEMSNTVFADSAPDGATDKTSTPVDVSNGSLHYALVPIKPNEINADSNNNPVLGADGMYQSVTNTGRVSDYTDFPDGIMWFRSDAGILFFFPKTVAGKQIMPTNWSGVSNSCRNEGHWSAHYGNMYGGINIPNFVYLQIKVCDIQDYRTYKKTGKWPAGFAKRAKIFSRFINVQR